MFLCVSCLTRNFSWEVIALLSSFLLWYSILSQSTYGIFFIDHYYVLCCLSLCWALSWYILCFVFIQILFRAQDVNELHAGHTSVSGQVESFSIWKGGKGPKQHEKDWFLIWPMLQTPGCDLQCRSCASLLWCVRDRGGSLLSYICISESKGKKDDTQKAWKSLT